MLCKGVHRRYSQLMGNIVDIDKDLDLNPVKDLKPDRSTSVPFTPYHQVAWPVGCEDNLNTVFPHTVSTLELFSPLE